MKISSKIPHFSALVCDHPFGSHLIKNKDRYFGGLQAFVFNSFCPKKYLNITFHETKDCFLGIRNENRTFSGMLGEIERSDIDIGVLFARHDVFEDSSNFILSPAINCEYAIFYYFLKMDTRMTNILSSIKIINWDIYLLFTILFSVIFLYCLIKFKKMQLINKLRMLFDLFFGAIQLILQNSIKINPKLEKKLNDKLLLLFNICITFFFMNFFLASLNNSYIELDRTNMLETIDDLANHPVIDPIMSKSSSLETHFRLSKDSTNQKIWMKMIKKGLDSSLMSIKNSDIDAMVRCAHMMKNKKLAYIINRLSLSLVIAGYCSSLYQVHKMKNNNYVMWISNLFSPMPISIPYNRKIDPYLRKRLDTYFETFSTYGIIHYLNERVTLTFRQNVGSKNFDCVVNERKKIADAEATHSLCFENFLYAFLLLVCLELLSVLSFVFCNA